MVREATLAPHPDPLSHRARMVAHVPIGARPLPRFCVVDLETSGLSTRRHRIVQLGLVVVDAGAIVDQWSTLVRLRWPFQRVGPRHVHGISRSDLRGAPALGDVLGELHRRLDGGVFTADTGVRIPGPPIGTNTTGQEPEGPSCLAGSLGE